MDGVATVALLIFVGLVSNIAALFLYECCNCYIGVICFVWRWYNCCIIVSCVLMARFATVASLLIIVISITTVASVLFMFSGAVRCAMNFCVLSLSHRSPSLLPHEQNISESFLLVIYLLRCVTFRLIVVLINHQTVCLLNNRICARDGTYLEQTWPRAKMLCEQNFLGKFLQGVQSLYKC